MIIKQHFKFPLLLTATLLLLTVELLYRSDIWQNSSQQLIASFQKKLHSDEKLLLSEITKLSELLKNRSAIELFDTDQDKYRTLYHEHSILLFVYEHDTLKFWSSSAVEVDTVLNSSSFHSRLIRFKNGWYEAVREEEGNKTIIGLLTIKTTYPYRNKYLVSGFYNQSIPDETEIVFEENYSYPELKSYNGTHLCLLKFPENGNTHIPLPWLFFLCAGYLITFLLIVLWLQNFWVRMEYKVGINLATSLFILSVIALRIFILLAGWPDLLKTIDLFRPDYYAASLLFSSPGDLFINALLMFYLASYAHAKMDITSYMMRLNRKPAVLFVLFFTAIGFLSAHHLISGLVENSNISFNANNIFELAGSGGMSFIGIVSVWLVLFSVFFPGDIFLSALSRAGVKSRELIAGLAVSMIIFIADFFLFPVPLQDFTLLASNYNLGAYFFFALIIAAIWYVRKKGSAYSFNRIVLLVMLFTLYAAFTITRHTNDKENRKRVVLAEKIALETDPVMEHLYAETEPEILSGNSFLLLRQYPDENSKEQFDKALEQRHFTTYFNRYNIKTWVYRRGSFPVGLSGSELQRKEQIYFERQISKFGKPTENSNLYYIESPEEIGKYIARIRLDSGRTEKKHPTGGGYPKGDSSMLYITFEPKLTSDEIGFPALLLDDAAHQDQELRKYSFAKYSNARLLSYYGNYRYPLQPRTFNPGREKSITRNVEGYEHLIYVADNQNMIIISKPQPGWIEQLTMFSLLFILFSLLVFVFIWLRNSILYRKWFINVSITQKIQLLLVSVLFTSLLLFGAGTTYYIMRQFKEKNNRIISEKIHSVLKEVQQKIGGQQRITPDLYEYISFILTKFSSVFFTDINLYNLDGSLLGTSRPALFREGIISGKMDPGAFLEIVRNNKIEFIQTEQIGRMEYQSAYVPFRTQSGETLAYLNLPYFAKQDALETELSLFIAALINIYVVLFALTIVTALFISNIITQPLRMLQEMLGRVEFGKYNEPILYSGKDEIGQLIDVYNRKVEELRGSADLLAKSERESAWREMAKQVAHEIKNPLTPMKLNIQHLERTLKTGDPESGHQLKRFTQTMIEQIDTLSYIASEFSNFAQMPVAHKEKVNIVSVIKSALELYKDTPHVNVSLSPGGIFLSEDKAQIFVLADKDQLIRVINNLLKNAIQSIPAEREGEVQVDISSDEKTAGITISDNGTGIPDELKDKIFLPNFTTKTGGMGLGLAIVKNIVDTMDGKIRFNTKPGEGTAFSIEFPAME